MKIPNKKQAAGLELVKHVAVVFAALDRERQPSAETKARAEMMQAAADWIAELLDSETTELVIDVNGTSRGGLWCSNCPGNTCFGRCNWYRDLFDAPDGAPDELEIEPGGRRAPELCPLRDPRRAMLVRRLP